MLIYKCIWYCPKTQAVLISETDSMTHMMAYYYPGDWVYVGII